MSNLHQWIIVIQIVLNTSGVISGGDEHVHIKVHIPDLNRKHTHFRKIQKHHFHPKKVVKTGEFLDADLDTTPFSMMTYGYGLADHGQAMQFPSHPVALPSFPDIPTYGVDNTLEATIMKKPKMHSMPQFMSEGMLTKFHGMKKPSEFMGAHPADQLHRFSKEEEDEDTYADEYDTRSTESMFTDQRVAGSSYPYSMSLGSGFKSKWPSYSNVFVSSARPYNSGMKMTGSLPDWLSATTDDDYSSYEKFPSTTTMHIARTKPLSSSRLKFQMDPYSEPWIAPKKKRSKTEMSRTPSSGFRINY